ncbi:MAG: adenine phosphoribosyltransferase [Candidatus Gygaella obscura]|nr:adenine phosphoribosyltransferase [Candidatus Gygaella obscura]
MDQLQKWIRDIPDFPKKGIIFKDITTLLNNPDAFKKTIDILVEKFKSEKIDYIVGIESRGFIFGGALAYQLGCGFVPVRKKGKLPAKTIAVTYDLEYGTDTLEMHEDAFKKGAKILVIDDLLATGGTAQGVCRLIKQLCGELVGVCFLIELTFLNGRDKLKDCPIFSIIKY